MGLGSTWRVPASTAYNQKVGIESSIILGWNFESSEQCSQIIRKHLQANPRDLPSVGQEEEEEEVVKA